MFGREGGVRQCVGKGGCIGLYRFPDIGRRFVDVWTSLGAKVCVFQNVSPEFGKGGKRQIKLLAKEIL